jgi:hypothetical protein
MSGRSMGLLRWQFPRRPYGCDMTFGYSRLIAFRHDYGIGGQAIRFTGQEWRDYVPIRISSTRCVYHDVPPGSAAVLVKRALQSSGSMPLTWAQDRLFHAINGFRTLGDIVSACGTTKGAQRALQFFEKLYRHDHIVFDASKVPEIRPFVGGERLTQSLRDGS